MTTHALVVYLSVALAISVGLNAVFFVLWRLHSGAFWRMKSVFRDYRSFHVKCVRFGRSAVSNLFLELATAKDEIKQCRQERSFFLAQWKIFGPLAAKLEVLSEYWESETHYWRKKCWWLSDRIAQERDREVIYAAMKAAAGAAHAATAAGGRSATPC